jgi:peptidoglycan/xylan/chitin deacetylase (PgdA/CDA1 family)
VNLPSSGKKEAVSKCHMGGREEVRFASSLRGLELMVGMLEEIGIKATFFFEGETLLHIARHIDVRELLAKHEVACHGVCHEDITGEATGIRMTGPEIVQMIDQSKSIVRSIFAREPVGFRAPYQHVDQRTLYLLHKKDFLYDSSMTKAIDEEDESLHPWKVVGDMLEIPIAQGRDRLGKRLVSYLWPMHEGKRVPSDYIQMAANLHSGVVVFATHTWHLVETYSRGLLSESSISINIANVRAVLEGARAEEVQFLPLEDIAKAWEG